MIFSSGQTQGSGFKARFLFATGNFVVFPSFSLFLLILRAIDTRRVFDTGDAVSAGRLQFHVRERQQEARRIQLTSPSGPLPVQPDVHLQLYPGRTARERPSLLWPIQSARQRHDRLLRVYIDHIVTKESVVNHHPSSTDCCCYYPLRQILLPRGLGRDLQRLSRRQRDITRPLLRRRVPRTGGIRARDYWFKGFWSFFFPFVLFFGLSGYWS